MDLVRKMGVCRVLSPMGASLLVGGWALVLEALWGGLSETLILLLKTAPVSRKTFRDTVKYFGY